MIMADCLLNKLRLQWPDKSVFSALMPSSFLNMHTSTSRKRVSSWRKLLGGPVGKKKPDFAKLSLEQSVLFVFDRRSEKLVEFPTSRLRVIKPPMVKKKDFLAVRELSFVGRSLKGVGFAEANFGNFGSSNVDHTDPNLVAIGRRVKNLPYHQNSFPPYELAA